MIVILTPNIDPGPVKGFVDLLIQYAHLTDRYSIVVV